MKIMKDLVNWLDRKWINAVGSELYYYEIEIPEKRLCTYKDEIMYSKMITES